MTSYPQGKDVFRRWLSGCCDMIAQDLNDLFDSAVAIETELGVEPSGRMGTVLGRLFARGNLSKSNGRWRRLEWGIISNRNGWEWGEATWKFQQTYAGVRYRGSKTEFGDDVPMMFMVLQARVPNFGGWPWNICCFDIDGENERGVFWGRDANNAELTTGNSRSDTMVAWLHWGVI